MAAAATEGAPAREEPEAEAGGGAGSTTEAEADRKSTRLNSSHVD